MANEKENLTPEEQLLRLIESTKPAAPTAPGQKAASAKPVKKKAAFKFPSLGVFKGKLAFAQGQAQKKAAALKKGPFKFNLQMANKILMGSCVLLAVFFFSNVIFFRSDPEKLFASGGEIFPVAPLSTATDFKPKALEYYKEPPLRRNVFAPFEPKKIENKEENKNADGSSGASAPSVKQIDQLTQGLKLVGISWGSDPQAMIEDTGKGRTYFVRPGQTMDKVQVRGVFRDRVILGYDDEEKELF